MKQALGNLEPSLELWKSETAFQIKIDTGGGWKTFHSEMKVLLASDVVKT